MLYSHHRISVKPCQRDKSFHWAYVHIQCSQQNHVLSRARDKNQIDFQLTSKHKLRDSLREVHRGPNAAANHDLLTAGIKLKLKTETKGDRTLQRGSQHTDLPLQL